MAFDFLWVWALVPCWMLSRFQVYVVIDPPASALSHRSITVPLSYGDDERRLAWIWSIMVPFCLAVRVSCGAVQDLLSHSRCLGMCFWLVLTHCYRGIGCERCWLASCNSKSSVVCVVLDAFYEFWSSVSCMWLFHGIPSSLAWVLFVRCCGLDGCFLCFCVCLILRLSSLRL